MKVLRAECWMPRTLFAISALSDLAHIELTDSALNTQNSLFLLLGVVESHKIDATRVPHRR